MPTRRVHTGGDKDKSTKRHRPATTPEARENQLISASFDLAERQIREGTASSQIIVHYLKLGSSREKLEQERLANENKLTEAKIEALAAAQRIEALYGEALVAMSSYQGRSPLEIGEGLDD